MYYRPYPPGVIPGIAKIGNAVSFHGTASATQTVSNSTFTKVLLLTKNGMITPTLPAPDLHQPLPGLIGFPVESGG